MRSEWLIRWRAWFSDIVARLRGSCADADAWRIRSVFERKFGIAFENPLILKTALTHRSVLDPEGESVSNERLEYLGDSVLGLIASEYLFRSMDEANEGELTKARSRLVSKTVLGRIGMKLGILDLLLYARSELRDDDRALTTLSADALEAVIGAIYIDRGMACASRFVIDRIIDPTSDAGSDEFTSDNKSALQEVCQAKLRVQPEYRIVRRTGPEHRKIFHVVVRLNGETYGFGSGRSRKEAEQVAAGQALLNLNSDNE